MSIRESYHSLWVHRLVVLIALSLILSAGRPAFGYTPTDPVVTKMVNQGVSYLENLKETEFGGGDPFSTVSGEAILIGYAHHKCRHDPDSVAVKRALLKVQRLLSVV